MANPLPNESEIYKKIEKNNLKIPRDIWELIEHHIGNDIHAINFIVGSYITGDSPEAIPPKDSQKILYRCDEIKKFLIKLREAAREAPKRD